MYNICLIFTGRKGYGSRQASKSCRRGSIPRRPAMYDDYPFYTLIFTANDSKGFITLTLLEDENHPIPIAMFPFQQKETAEFIL